MADLIERLNDAWRRLYADGDEHGVCDTIAEAADALEAARVEVERYRWLRREVFHGDIPVGEARLILEVTGSCPSRAEFDTAIDTARAADGGG